MAKFFRTKSGTAYFKITWVELADYSHNGFPVCDRCLGDLIGENSITLIPILNMAFCPKCAAEQLKTMKPYPEDEEIERRRERFYLDHFGLTDTTAGA